MSMSLLPPSRHQISPQFSNRVVTAGRELLNRLLPDVYIHTDQYKGALGGASPGYGVSMVAESTTGCLLAVDVHAEDGAVPEDVGRRASELLVEEVRGAGCVDSTAQSLMTLMALGPEDVGRLRTGPLTPFSMETLRLIRDALGVTFKIRADTDSEAVHLSCLGAGFKNFSRKVS
jgi:RNA 3'-terminal phosphate cyclase-like protein